MEKTDLKTILSVSGEHGLFRYLAQAKAGIIAESLETGRRTTFGAHARVSSLSDISIYTDEADISLKEVLKKMAENLSNGEAMSPKSDPRKIEAFFREVIPDYDADRFYVSHMKKILEWYNCLLKFASLDFAEEEDDAEAEEAKEA